MEAAWAAGRCASRGKEYIVEDGDVATSVSVPDPAPATARCSAAPGPLDLRRITPLARRVRSPRRGNDRTGLRQGIRSPSNHTVARRGDLAKILPAARPVFSWAMRRFGACAILGPQADAGKRADRPCPGTGPARARRAGQVAPGIRLRDLRLGEHRLPERRHARRPRLRRSALSTVSSPSPIVPTRH